MTIWLFLGLIFGATILLAFFFGRSRKGLVVDGEGVEPDEVRRRADSVAADAARMADARVSPSLQGGGRPI